MLSLYTEESGLFGAATNNYRHRWYVTADEKQKKKLISFPELSRYLNKFLKSSQTNRPNLKDIHLKSKLKNQQVFSIKDVWHLCSPP